MLAKKYRLPIQLMRTRKADRTIPTDIFLLKIFSQTLLYSRCGIIVSKGVAARAVDRNALRRLCFQSIGNFVKRSSSKDLLFILSPRIRSFSPAMIQEKIRATLARIA